MENTQVKIIKDDDEMVVIQGDVAFLINAQGITRIDKNK